MGLLDCGVGTLDGGAGPSSVTNLRLYSRDIGTGCLLFRIVLMPVALHLLIVQS